ncbi:hypothetical protein GC163_03230 [bacterium]|nr:hypothetical protein [bacterium]
MAKALKTLEASLGPPMNERLLRDAFNAANSAYLEISQRDNRMTIEAAVACTLVCACEGHVNSSLLGNFESALSQAEALNLDQIRTIEYEFSDLVRNQGGGG